MALLRARLLEILASQAGLRNRSGDLFLLGLFSLLDAMVGRPMEELLSEVGLPADVRAVLAGSAPAGARLGRLYRLALACEQGDWDTLRVLTRETGIEAGTVANGYVAAAEWCAEVFCGADAGRTPSRRTG
ncbi:MAG: hypothetical protein IPM24_20400 [Bryobacterales bacterium]|nr:hypothetical protein [Bryobacterales bacterium]